MDEDAELAALRRRAYGPLADIADDPAALARLQQLEHPAGAGARAGRAEDAAASRIRRIGEIRTEDDNSGLISPNRLIRPGGADSEAPEVLAPNRRIQPADAGPAAWPAPMDPDGGVAAEPSGRPASARPAWHTAMVAAVAALALLVGVAAATRTVESPRVEASVPPIPTVSDAAAAFRFAADPASDILVRIPLDGVSGQSLDLPLPEAGPRFPTDSDLRWSRTLGDYYGWQLWIARDADGRACMLIEASDILSRCVSVDEQGEGALFLSVPYAAVTEGERPTGMKEEQSIGFWWLPVDTVLVLTGRTTDAAGS